MIDPKIETKKELPEHYDSIFDLPRDVEGVNVEVDFDEESENDSTFVPKLNNQQTIDEANPFNPGDIDFVKDGGVAIPQTDVMPEAVDKSKVESNLEATKESLEKEVGEYNKKIDQAIELQDKILKFGEELKITTENVIAAIVDREDAWYEPGVVDSVRARQISQITNVGGGKDKMQEFKSQSEDSMAELDSVGEVITAQREKIKNIFQSLLSQCKNKSDVGELQDFLRTLKSEDEKLEILNKKEVEARYKSLIEGLLADCLVKMVELSRLLQNESQKEESASTENNAVTPSTSAESTILDNLQVKPSVDNNLTPESPTKKVEWEVFSQKGNEMDTGVTAEVDEFVTESPVVATASAPISPEATRILDIQNSLKKPLNPQQATEPINLQPSSTGDANQNSSMEKYQEENLTDMEGNGFGINLNNEVSDGGVKARFAAAPKPEESPKILSEEVATAEGAIPKLEQAPEVQKQEIAVVEPITAVPKVVETPAESQPTLNITSADENKAKKGGFLSWAKGLFGFKEGSLSDEVTHLDAEDPTADQAFKLDEKAKAARKIESVEEGTAKQG